jgi:thiol-disulfide isomerase/thioredoxin
MKKHIFICFILAFASWQVQAQVAEIKPEKPQRGETVTITYHPGAPGAVIGKDATGIDMVFTYSTFYEQPWRLPMKKVGEDWVASFVLQRYATFATFYFQSGELVDKPAPDRHYNIAVYKGDKRVEDGLLHESYSLGAQMPKSANVAPLQLELLRRELVNYPNNYEAKVRIQSIQMALAKTPEEKFQYRKEARRIIAAKFEENPTFGGNLNKVTMGYLMIGENTRLDSIRRVVAIRYPKSDLAKGYRTGQIEKEKDSVKRAAQLESLLKESDEAGEENSTEIHGLLFDYYASIGNAAKAVEHAQKSLGKQNPYTAKNYKDIAATLTTKKLAPDTALDYLNRSLKLVDTWPIGVIRYFPEYSYIRPFVADSIYKNTVAGATSEIYALMAVNKLYLNDQKSALQYAAKAEAEGTTRESLLNVAKVYEEIQDFKKAFAALWNVLLKDPSDTASIAQAKTDFLKFNNSEADFNIRVKNLEELKIAQLTTSLRKQMMNKPSPELNNITDLKGNKVTKEMMKGKIVIMDFWATWCVPCMQELPYLQKVYNKYKNNPKVMFMVVNSGAKNTIKDAIGWEAKNRQYTFPLYFNNDPDIGDKVGFTVIPTIAVIDQNGIFQFRTVGFEGAELEHKLSAQIQILLGN